MDLATGLAGLNAALETLKGLRGLEKAYDQAVLKAQIVDLMGHVSDAKLALLNAKEEIQARDAELGALKAKLEKRSATVQSGGFSYVANAEGYPTGEALCTVCLNGDGSQIPLSKAPGRRLLCTRCHWVTEGAQSFP